MEDITYIKSDAFKYTSVDDHFEIVNLISGKAFKLSAYIVALVNLCSSRKTIKQLKDKMRERNLTDEQIDSLLNFLTINKIILLNKRDAFCDFVRSSTSCFNLGYNDINKINHSITFIGVPFGLGNSVDSRCKDFPQVFRNISTSFFPLDNSNIIRKASVHFLFDSESLNVALHNKVITDLGNIFHCTGEGISQYYDKISHAISQIRANNNVPFVLGGDHSITYPIVKGLSQYNKDIIILHFDAHSDFKDSSIIDMYDTANLELLNHATVMTYCARHENVSHIIQFGVREPFISENSKISSISLYDMRRKSEAYQSIINKACEIYLSFDIDFFDPMIAPGTASRLINGALYDETFTYLAEILHNKKIIGVDLVEINPKIDFSNSTIHLAINLILHLLSLIKI